MRRARPFDGVDVIFRFPLWRRELEKGEGEKEDVRYALLSDSVDTAIRSVARAAYPAFVKW